MKSGTFGVTFLWEGIKATGEKTLHYIIFNVTAVKSFPS